MAVSKNGKYKKKLEELLTVCRKNLRTVNSELIERAFNFSFDAHKNDIRASGEPFFDHPYEAALIIAREIPLDDVSVASALLHDVVEDTEYTIDDVRAEFGGTIADIVDGATKITNIFKSHEITRAENYRKLLLSMVNDIRVMLVKFADRLHNMRTLEYLPPEKQVRLAKETLEIYAPFAHRFGLGKIKWELEDLAFKYSNRKIYDELSRQLNAKRREREHFIKKFIQPIEKRLNEEGMQFEISGRPKHLFSIYNKMQQRNKPLEEIYDLFAVRVILDTENNNDCFAVYGITSEIYIPIPERFKNYISIPKKNGYQSIHTTVVGPNGKMVEVQIRTRAMHEVAEKGVAAHWRYKENVSALDKELEDWVSWVREVFDHKNDDASRKELIESFKLNLYQDEIYVFTPQGELKIMPKGSTPVDFAYEIHSQVGSHAIGAKVNGRIVPLNSILRSGDQVEIITSKNQTPNADWDKFVVTHKAKTHIRRWIKEEQRKFAITGKELWDKKLKKVKLHISDDDLTEYVRNARFDNLTEFYSQIAQNAVNLDAFIEELELKLRHPQPVEPEKESIEKTSIFKQFVKTARNSLGSILVTGTQDVFMHTFAKCCNPVPGDEIVGFVTTGEGIKIHRKSCQNAQRLYAAHEDRLIEVSWPVTQGQLFVGGIKFTGDDRPGMLNEITKTISSYNNTNIRSVNIDSKETMFHGWILIYVNDLEHLAQIITRLKKVPGIHEVERFEKQ